MAEVSLPWDGNSASGGVGDCGPYAANAWDDLYRFTFITGQHATEGVLVGALGQLNVTGAGSPVSVGSGAAFVNGKFYKNTAAKNVDVPTPTGATRIDRIVLRADYTAQTVRIARLAGAEGGGAPALTQNDGVIWEISLAQVSITTAGAITITDERAYCHFGSAVNAAMIDTGAVTNAKLADGAVTNAKLAAAVKRMQGEIIMWSGALNGHYPVDPVTGLPNIAWHICNGDTENGVVTPNLADKFVIAQSATYTKGDTGGSATKDLAHTHGVGGIAVAAHSSHTHPVNIESAFAAIGQWLEVEAGAGADTVSAGHKHNVIGNTGSGGATAHTISGSTASAGSATQDIMPPYYCLIFLCYVGA